MNSRAINFEKLGKSRTFIIYDETDSKVRLLAYFTLALQVLKIPEQFSNRKILQLDGFSAKFNGEKITEIPVILIGQIAKNDQYRQYISGHEIMQYSMSTLLDGQNRISGRVVLLECKDIPYLVEFYNKFGFTKINREYSNNELIQMVKILSEEEII